MPPRTPPSAVRQGSTNNNNGGRGQTPSSLSSSRRMPGCRVFNALDAGLYRYDELLRVSLEWHGVIIQNGKNIGQHLFTQGYLKSGNILFQLGHAGGADDRRSNTVYLIAPGK